MKNQEYHTVEIIIRANRKIVETGKIDNPNTQIHGCSLFCLVTDTP